MSIGLARAPFSMVVTSAGERLTQGCRFSRTSTRCQSFIANNCAVARPIAVRPTTPCLPTRNVPSSGPDVDGTAAQAARSRDQGWRCSVPCENCRSYRTVPGCPVRSGRRAGERRYVQCESGQTARPLAAIGSIRKRRRPGGGPVTAGHVHHYCLRNRERALACKTATTSMACR